MAASICIEAALAVDNLTGIRGGRTLFRGLSFAVAPGRALAVEGANGTGKTSLLRLLAGFLAPAGGTIRFGGVEDGEERGKCVGWLGHHDAVKAQMTVRETLGFFARLHGGGDIDAAMEKAGLARLADLPGQYLSAGQRKRVSLARLLLTARPLWLMDEPLASLDAGGKTAVGVLIAAHVAAGGIAVVATHEPLEIDCERLAL
jgi:heme exporter protein A